MKDPLGIAGKRVDGKYALEEAIGEGGTAVVYRAKNVAWDMPVAMKIYVSLSDTPTDQRAAVVATLMEEGRIMSHLSTKSAAVTQPRDMGSFVTDDGRWLPFLALEWLEGEPLDVVLVSETERGIPPRGLEDTARLLEPVAEALAIAHAENVAHRDVKPENMFVVGTPRTADERLKLLDFGIAKTMHAKYGSLLHTSASATAFTPHYGAPEQYSRGYGATGPWTDVFALALVFIEVMRGGNRAFRGDDYLELSAQSRDETFRPTPRALGLPVNDDVEAVFARALAVRPADRYANVGDMWTALRSAMNPRAAPWSPGGARPASASRPSAAASTGPSSAPAGGAPAVPTTRSKGSRGIVAIAAVVGLGLVVGSAVVAGRRATRSPPQALAPSAGDGRASASASTAGAPSASASTGPKQLCLEGSVVVPGGSFTMGDASIEGATPEHKVHVDAFCLDHTEVTAGDYAACVSSGACAAPAIDISSDHAGTTDARVKQCNSGSPERKAHPMNCVTYDEAARYCGSRGMRLPTEAEWEYAAAGSEGRAFPWGEDPPKGRSNACGAECARFAQAERLPARATAYDLDDGFAGTAPVGSFSSGDTKLGIADLAGNVAEWTSDYFAPYADSEEVNPKGPASGASRVVRGGSFESAADRLHSAARASEPPTTRSPGIGFRCASALSAR